MKRQIIMMMMMMMMVVDRCSSSSNGGGSSSRFHGLFCCDNTLCFRIMTVYSNFEPNESLFMMFDLTI